VVKFDVEGKELRALNEIFCKLPNEDSHPEYNPHMTLAYVRKGMGKNFVRESQRFARVPVNMIEYSDRGVKSYYNL
jgi:2'-5' RNA ligase